MLLSILWMPHHIDSIQCDRQPQNICRQRCDLRIPKPVKKTTIFCESVSSREGCIARTDRKGHWKRLSTALDSPLSRCLLSLSLSTARRRRVASFTHCAVSNAPPCEIRNLETLQTRGLGAIQLPNQSSPPDHIVQHCIASHCLASYHLPLVHRISTNRARTNDDAKVEPTRPDRSVAKSSTVVKQ